MLIIFRVGDEVEEDEEDIEDRKMTRDDFDYIVARIDRMELSVASIINKVFLFFNIYGSKILHFFLLRLIDFLAI